MEINVNKFRQSVHWLREHANSLPPADSSVLQKFEKQDHYSEENIRRILDWLSDHLLEATYTEQIAMNFEEFLLLLLSKSICDDDHIKTVESFAAYQRKCVAIAKLLRLSVEAKRYATKYFCGKPAPFDNHFVVDEGPPRKRSKNVKDETQCQIDNLALLRCCYQLLSADPTYFKNLWNWSLLVDKYLITNQNITHLERLYFNHILSILTNMSPKQLNHLNAKIHPEVLLKFDDEENTKPKALDFKIDVENPELVTYNFQSDTITNIEGVLLPVFNQENYKFYARNDGLHEQIVKVDSTKVNLRSIALGIAAAKTICLSGPVGCGKTTLVQYLARKTGRVCPKAKELEAQKKVDKENTRQSNGVNNIENFDESLLDLINVDANTTNGFLRIQLGDQTDSKMLLGQYRCTDVPGEFIWLPGILTQAVMNGYWLLLEDLDSATQDTYTILSGLLENNYLSVPGFRDCVKVEPGFQLFVTVRTNKSSTNSAQRALFCLLEKYLYTINILPLSRNELCKVVSTNYPKLATVANRIVDVFLTFSSGDHNVADNLRGQETDIKADNTEKYISLPFEPVSLSMIPNAGRLVSTRDLIKLCQRSNPVFSVTSTECAYFVFQNAVDVFCSNLPQGKEKTKLIVSIGAKLGIIQSRCETYANDYKPEVIVDSERIKVGRAELLSRTAAMKNIDDDNLDGVVAKRQKLSLEAEKCLSLQKRTEARVTFSFTRLASCLLERIALCVAHAEPVLLVGETGVGKTSSVQYLAERTEHKLVVVNMNNQSDVSDLIGGFKPVDLTYVLSPLRNEFESLFRATYDPYKNATFLSKFGSCYNENLFAAIVKMMMKVTDSILMKSEQNKLPSDISVLLPRWKHLKAKLFKLNSQLSKSINISFAFIPGSLVNCIKNGDWVLLDEINLASAETLECLSTILEPDGSVVLLEKGDFTPVRRHPDFRIFACMNPNTDIGKKDLPVGIRNRFTEFFVDELTTDNDLSLLISDYLINTGIQRKSVTNIVKLYKKLIQLAKLELNDGLGNRPVYSLRTLCRSLRICAKNLCGSIERNLYESFCMSFLTQLDPDSHKTVLSLIQTALLSNVKAVLKQSIPKPGEKYLDFEGYWIEQGPKQLQECANYILTESVKANLRDLARIISIGKLPILLQGPTSAGKTSLIEYVAKRSGNHCLRINNHEHTDLQEYIGTYVADETGKLTFREGVLVQAMRNGYWIILDELNLASTEILEALNRVLDDNRELFIPETQTVVKAHPNFMLFATQNPPGLYGGRKTLSRAFKNRFIELHFSEIPRHELEIILKRRCFIPPSYAKKMVMCMADLQKNRKTTSKNVFTLRDLFRWGNRYTFADKRLLEDKKYDWNQHLVEEGYLVLSAKVRTQLEIEIIEDALYRNFKKRIDLSRLFDVEADAGQRSPVTADIIEAIKSFKRRDDIVWTRNMTRMAVLTAKALQFDEPVLLVGPTGCGKTTVCQLLASIRCVQLRILNCHMHTEGADFLGGLRPCRKSNIEENGGVENTNSSARLFEWADGPLIHAMLEGSYFMADEISLAEDSVLERLNCILEPERTVLLAEKGGVAVNSGSNDLDIISSDFVVQAKSGFQFLATMNPGGDFGKKELSPALRNRFTEIWCLPSDDKEDLIQIASNCMNKELAQENSRNIASYLVEVVLYIRDNVEKFKFSVRDILAWAHYMICNAKLSFAERAIFGLETIFLDALEMLPHESIEQVELLRSKITHFAIDCASKLLGEKFNYNYLESKRGQEVIIDDGFFGLKPFLIPVGSSSKTLSKDFSFSAPTTKKNLFRLLSALSLHKPILLEGPPGVGKTSTVESLAKAIGYQIVRINLCEHTDLADLFGTDLPAEENVFNVEHKEKKENTTTIGSFVWRDGPLLAALKTENTWILLDELNLAPQSVLEGLNAILDHRGEVYIPELNKTFTLNRNTRIFACQNPLRQGGGRKGLPQSFLNRFNKVFLRKLTDEDLKYVVNEKYGKKFEELKERLIQPLMKHHLISGNLFELRRKILGLNISESESENCLNIEFDLANRLVRFSEALDQAVAKMELGIKGGPFEFNLRDILRWCDFLIDHQTGIHFKSDSTPTGAEVSTFITNFDSFLQTLYDTMKLVYIQRMRTVQDQHYIRNVFGQVFDCNSEDLNSVSEDVSLYWTDEHLYLNDLVLRRDTTTLPNQLRSYTNKEVSPLLLSQQREHLQNIVACVQHQKPILLCGSTDTGKTKLIDAVCTLSNEVCITDNIDDSVTGSFQQIDLNRHLEDLSQGIESIFWLYIQKLIFNHKERCNAVSLLDAWYKYTTVTKSYNPESNQATHLSKELQLFRERLQHLVLLTKNLLNEEEILDDPKKKLKQVLTSLKMLQRYTNHAETLNMGGSFEWVDSKIVKSLKFGQYIALEHVNLCSSAVLDRLNPVFEPNGNLLISEKGVSSTESSEIVEKSENFRVFLTVDPKNGELSRAMRNRCVELALPKDAFSLDDMRQIIYSHGVHDIIAINCILEMHNTIKELTQINNYSISHLNQCAFLVSSYKRIGYATARSIYISGMEVYVYSANVDMLGYGLSYYQNKLRNIVLEYMHLYIKSVESKKAVERQEDYFAPLILHCGDLNKVTMTKLQAVPLKLLLKPDTMTELVMYLQNFKDLINFEQVDKQSLMRFYLFTSYESSAFIDLEVRHNYLQKVLNEHPSQVELKALSVSLYNRITAWKLRFQSNVQHIPWNSKLFPRIRDYTKVSPNPDMYRLSGLLIVDVLLNRLPKENITNLQNLTALNYARALSKRLVTTKSNHTFLKSLDGLLTFSQNLFEDKISQASLDVPKLTMLFTKLHWFNRLLSLANTPIFVRKEINISLLDKLMLHYEWLCKHLLSYLAQISGETHYQQFGEIFIKVDEFINTVKPKLNRLRKLYVKHMLAFQPYYEMGQVDLRNLVDQLDNLLCVVPSYGCFTQENILRKFKCQREPAALKARALLSKTGDSGIVMPEIKLATPLPEGLHSVFQKYISVLNTQKESVQMDESFTIAELQKEIEVVSTEISSQNELSEGEIPNEIQLCLTSIREFFVTKALVQKTFSIRDEHLSELNMIFCDELPTLCNDDWQLIRTHGEAHYSNLLSLVKHLMSYVSNIHPKDVLAFGKVIESLNGSYKELNAIWRILVYKSQKRQLLNLSTHFNCTQVISNNIEEINAESQYEGPPLVNSCLSLLFQTEGNLKPVPLKDLYTWKHVLRQMNQLLWQNASLLTPSFDQLKNNNLIAHQHAEKLLLEIAYNNTENAHLDDDYQKLLVELRSQVDQSHKTQTKQHNLHGAQYLQQMQYQTGLLNALIGAVELSTLISTPLIDPVEKQRLKKVYLEEDISSLTTMTMAYDFMRIVLKYKHFADEIYEEQYKQLQILKNKQLKQNQSVALRPKECMYVQLVQDIHHYLSTNCLPSTLLKLIRHVQTVWEAVIESSTETRTLTLQELCRETSMKLTLWISNARRFVFHVLKPYSGYYEDFLQPLRCAVQQFTFGLESLKTVICQLQHSIIEDAPNHYINYNQSGHIHRLVGSFAEFPTTRVLKSTPKRSITSTENVSERLRMLQLKLDSLSKHVHIAKELKDQSFEYLNTILSEYNEIWQIEEERLRLRKAEEDSLYVHKTKCETEDEELVEQQEIEAYFPTHVDEDYGEYLNTDTLEQTKKVVKAQSKNSQMISDDLAANIVQEFMDLLELYADINYYKQKNSSKSLSEENLDFKSMAKKRMQTFVTLYSRHKLCLNDWMDEKAYNNICLAVSMQERRLSEVPSNSNSKTRSKLNSYNFYKDSNIPEIIACTELLDRIFALVKIQLDLYPDHASLLDIQQIISRIRLLPSNAPLVRFSTGFQLLRQKVSQWNEVAHKNNHLRNEEIELAEYVQKWMRLELQCWRNSLNQTQSQVEAHAFRYWFYIYNLLLEYLQNKELDCSYTDIKYAEKRFGESEILDTNEVAEKNKVVVMDIVRILRQFIEASCYGDFHVRMRLLQSFELYLHCNRNESDLEYKALIAGLRNLQVYFMQFAQEIAESKTAMRTPIEKKLKEFVKIESYNKDLSYFSMKNNVARVHRNLNKFLKEYRLQLQQKITPVFQPQDSTVKDYNFENVKGKALRFDGKVKYNLTLDVKHFIAPEDLSVKSDNLKVSDFKDSLLGKAGKYFTTSRNVVKSTIQYATYPQMITALDELLSCQLERCEQLRSLNVDRTKERPKQVLEAKQILQQKRKGLTDLFKVLTQLGISYKSGLLEQTLNTECVDYTLPPFCIRNMLCSDSPKEKQVIYANMLQLYENLDSYYAKSVFKLKLLRNTMLTPLSELGPPNIERIKGFSVSMFLLVQRQRRLLSEATIDCYDLKCSLRQLRSLANVKFESTNMGTQLNFAGNKQVFEALKNASTQIRYVLEQFSLLLDCAPKQAETSQQVFTDSSGILTQDTKDYAHLVKACGKAIEIVKELLNQMSKCDVMFLSQALIQELRKEFENLLELINSLKDTCVLSTTSEYLPLAKPLVDLLSFVENNMKEAESTCDAKMDESIKDNIDFEVEEVLQGILLSLQKLYKLHPKPDLDNSSEGKPSPTKRNTLEDEQELQPQHMKTLYNSLNDDWGCLKVNGIAKQLDEILKKLSTSPATSSKLVQLRKLLTLLPLLEQYSLMAEYQILQQLGAHKVSAKMLSIMLTVFVEVSTKGFCVPPDLMHDEEQGERKKDQKEGEGFGLEDGTGEKDASDKIESEDQLDDAKRPEDRKQDKENEEKQDNLKEEKGIEMSEDFDAEMQDIEKPENEEDDSGESENEDDLNKEMGETEEGADKLDDQIWGDDEEEEKQEEEQELKEEEEGKGTKDEKDTHNDLDTKNDSAKNKDDTDEHDKNGLDATNEPPEEDKRKKQKQDIEDMKDPEEVEDQANPFHNELEEPPEPEEMDLGDMNNNDEENDGENEQEDSENPFDIDSMKQNMPETKEENADKNETNEEKEDNSDGDADSSEGSDDEPDNEANENAPEHEKNNEEEEDNDEDNITDEKEADTQKRGDSNEEEDTKNDDEAEEEKKEEKPEEHAPSHDKSSTEKNVQSMPNLEDKGSADQAQTEEDDKNIKQDQKLDEQETGEEKDGVGQAENEENDGGHQGIAETKEAVSKEDRKNEQETKEKRKQGRTNEERSLGEAEKNKLKQLKTIDKLKEDDKNPTEPDVGEDDKDLESEEYQHVKEPKNSDKTTLDNATEEQSKQIKHQEDEQDKEDKEEDSAQTNEDMMDTNEEENTEEIEKLEEISAEKNDKQSKKPSKSEKAQERSETQEPMEVEGEIVSTMTVGRSADTTAHCNKEILLDTTQADESTAAELLEMRKLYQQQVGSSKGMLPEHEHYELWQTISNRMSQNARELCEQLRLILEPTKCTRLKGDYRTGRRINMKKIIPYIASQFRKDKIWLRRTKPAQRDYKITIAIDDSKSMHHNNSKVLTLEAISLVSQALTLLESGRLSVVSFGEAPKIILNHTEQFDGPKLVNALNFSQDKTKIAELLDFIRTVNTEEGYFGTDNGLFENLLLVLSDGRNIFSEGKTKVRNSIKLARLQRIFLVYVIIDNPENKNSILDIQTMEMLPDSRINIKSYLDDFPFPYYVIVRDLNQLPLVLSEAMRQWFELVNSEQ